MSNGMEEHNKQKIPHYRNYFQSIGLSTEQTLKPMYMC